MSERRIDITIPVENVDFRGTCEVDGLKEVCDDFKNASIIRVLTYGTVQGNRLYNLTALENKDIKLIAGSTINRDSSNTFNEKDIIDQFKQLQGAFTLSNYKSEKISLNFSFTSHAKIVGTENIMYIGSANYSKRSIFNYEAGFIVRDKRAIKKIYEEYFDRLPTVEFQDDDYVYIRNSLSRIEEWLEELLSSLLVFPDLDCREISGKSIKENYAGLLNELQYSYKEAKERDLNDLADVIEDELLTSIEGFQEIIDSTFGLSFNDSFEELVDKYEDLFREECGLNPGQEWISEDEPYIPLQNQEDKEYIVGRFWETEVTNNKEYNSVYKFFSEIPGIIKEAKTMIPNKENSCETMLNEAIARGKDREIVK